MRYAQRYAVRNFNEKNIFGGNTLSVCRQDNLHIFMRNARTVDCEIVFDLFALGCLTIIYCAVLRELCANLKIYREFLPRYS